MAKHSKDRGIGLIQSGPATGDLIGRLKRTLSASQTQSAPNPTRKREVGKKTAATWTIGTAALLALFGANQLFQGNKDALSAKLGLESVPALPSPREGLGIDEQALYWTYALYDIASFRKRFGVSGYYAINESDARRKLEKLLPGVSRATLGQISAYTSVAFKTVPVGGRP